MTSLRSPFWRPVALAIIALQLAGCLSVKTRAMTDSGGQGGGVSLRVFADDEARRANQPGPPGLASELQRQEGGGWTTVFRSLDPAWTILHLPPGKYRLRFPARLDEEGHVVQLKERDRALRVEDNRITEVDATLQHVSGAWVAVGVVTAVVAAVLLNDWLDHHDLPVPPLPVPPPGMVEAMVYLTFDLADASWRSGPGSGSAMVTSHFPAEGAVVASPRTRILFALSGPAPVREVKADGLAVLGEKSGLVPGVLRFEPAHGWLVWEPSQDLERGDTFHVTLADDAIELANGRELPEKVSFSFRTADATP